MLFRTISSSNVLLALFAALTWGGGDFSGGMAVKRDGGSLRSALHVVLLVHLASLVALLILIAVRADPRPVAASVAWGLAAGVSAGICVIAFYVCLARGAMGSSAAISGLLAAAIPVLVSTALEGSPGPAPLTGFLLAAVAIWLIAAGPQREQTPRSILFMAVVAGIGFGLYFVALRMASPAGVLWPLALSRCSSISVALVGMLILRHHQRPGVPAPHAPWLTWASARWAIATAILDTAGNLFYIAAIRSGRLDVAAVLASLYPASTILLAAGILRERPTPRQGMGMALAAAAVVLITH